MTTFALGTAAGDLSAVPLQLGYFWSGVMFAAVMLVPALAYWRLRVSAVLTFWFAYVVTRPLGASFADWMAISHARGGPAWGPGPVSIGLALLIVALVGYLTVLDRRPAHQE